MDKCGDSETEELRGRLLDTLTNGGSAPEKANFVVIVIRRKSTNFLSTASQHKGYVSQ